VTPALALATSVTGTLLTLAPLNPADVRAARRAIDPTAPYEQDPDVAADLALIRRTTAWLPTWQHYGAAELDHRLLLASAAEDRLLAAHGHLVPTTEQCYQRRTQARIAAEAIQAAADLAHPPANCPRCHGWEDCPAADRAHRDAIHSDWATRWHTA
jgi:hypothetical protein